MENILTSHSGQGSTAQQSNQQSNRKTGTDHSFSGETANKGEAVQINPKSPTSPAKTAAARVGGPLLSGPMVGSQVRVPDFANLDTDTMIRALRDYILARLDEEKAEDIVTISLEGKSEIADAMVIASGRSARHVSAIADKLMRSLKEAGMQDAKVEGQPSCDWVLIDAGDIIVHLFRPEVRDFYNLERIWSEAARAQITGTVKN